MQPLMHLLIHLPIWVLIIATHAAAHAAAHSSPIWVLVIATHAAAHAAAHYLPIWVLIIATHAAARAAANSSAYLGVYHSQLCSRSCSRSILVQRDQIKLFSPLAFQAWWVIYGMVLHVLSCVETATFTFYHFCVFGRFLSKGSKSKFFHH